LFRTDVDIFRGGPLENLGNIKKKVQRKITGEKFLLPVVQRKK
jgi:hypothetical protein